MNIELLKMLEKNGSLKISTFLTEFKELIISLMKKGLTYKEIVVVLNEEAKKHGLKVKVNLGQLTGYLVRKNLTKENINDLDVDVKEFDKLVKEKATQDKAVEVFKNLVEK